MLTNLGKLGTTAHDSAKSAEFAEFQSYFLNYRVGEKYYWFLGEVPKTPGNLGKLGKTPFSNTYVLHH